MRYLAIANADGIGWNDRTRKLVEDLAHSTGLAAIIKVDGLAVLVNSEMPLIRLGNDGIVLGKLFDGLENKSRLTALDESAEAKLRATAGAALVENYWGAYVAIFRDDANRQVHVVRDPSSMFPCYYLQHEGLAIVASDVEILLDTELFDPRINWAEITRHLLLGELRRASTGLSELSELIGGCRLTFGSRGGVVSQIWSPWRFADKDSQITDASEAIRRLHETVLGCIAGHASDCEHVLLSLSGGLDSSIVAAALHRTGIPVSCLTLATTSPFGDERHFAAQVAKSIGAPLYELIEDVKRVDVERSDATHLPRPVVRAFAQSGDRKLLETAAQTGATAIFDGGGGDNVFCHIQSATMLADRLLAEGLGRGALRTAKDLSLLTNTSLWVVLRMAVRRAWFRDHNCRWSIDRSLLTSQAALQVSDAVRHPWLQAPVNTLPGKTKHVAGILAFHNYLEGFDSEGSPPRVSPLMSQPLIELCLSIPTWLWCQNGRDRAMARQAFVGDLPASIVHRRSKGTPDSFIFDIVMTNRARIREMLLDGLLAQHEILDRDSVAHELKDARMLSGVGVYRIMSLVDVEAWAQSWSCRRGKHRSGRVDDRSNVRPQRK